jgi:DNA-3-methyladenine glycosylase II
MKPRSLDPKTEEALRHLAKDKKLGQLAKKVILPAWSDEEVDLFAEIVESIVNQQLSGKAAATIYGRVKALLPSGKVEPRALLKVPDEQLRSAGMSRAKVAYVKGVAQAVQDKQLELDKLERLPDEEVISELTKLKGIGRWTAEMLLMFALRRPDVFSTGDLALRSAVARHFDVDVNDLKAIEELSKTWSPYRTTAARLLWHSSEPK